MLKILTQLLFLTASGCDSPPHVPQATFESKASYSTGDRIVYTCNTGFRLQSATENFLICEETGEWDGTTPICTGEGKN